MSSTILWSQSYWVFGRRSRKSTSELEKTAIQFDPNNRCAHISQKSYQQLHDSMPRYRLWLELKMDQLFIRWCLSFFWSFSVFIEFIVKWTITRVLFIWLKKVCYEVSKTDKNCYEVSKESLQLPLMLYLKRFLCFCFL